MNGNTNTKEYNKKVVGVVLQYTPSFFFFAEKYYAPKLFHLMQINGVSLCLIYDKLFHVMHGKAKKTSGGHWVKVTGWSNLMSSEYA